MNIRTTKLDKELFLNDLAYLNKSTRLQKTLESNIEIVKKILDACISSVDFLRNLDSIENEEIQDSCRQAVFAQMFDTRLNYNYHGKRYSQNYIDYCKNQIAVIKMPHPQGSVVVSKYGNILIKEGLMWINGRGFYGPYTVVRKIIDGNVSWILGVYSNAGKFVIPFGLFDDISLHLDGLYEAKYKNLEFHFFVRGDIADCSFEDLQEWMDASERDRLFISPDNIVFDLRCSGFMNKLSEKPNGQEFIDKITSYKLTKEIIQQELDRRAAMK